MSENKKQIKIKIPGDKGWQEIPQLPLKILVLSELSPQDAWAGGAPGAHQRISINKDNFNEVMEQLGLQARIEVVNRLGDTPKQLIVELSFKNLKSFHPEAVVEQVPALKSLLGIRQAVVDFRDRKMSRQDFERRLLEGPAGSALVERIQSALSAPRAQKAPAPPAAPTPSAKAEPSGRKKQDALDALFDMVEMPGSGPDEPPPSAHRVDSAMDQIISLVVSSGPMGETIDARSANAALADLDALLSAQLNEIMHHAEFRRLEAAWRGLKFLVDRTDFRQDIQIDILSVAKDDLCEVFRQRVFKPEYEGMADVPTSVIILDYEFDASPPDVERLQELAQMAERLQVPMVSAIGPAFLGLDAADELSTLPYLGQFFSRPEYIKWNGLRQSEASRWLALAFNRFVLRAPYGSEDRRVKAFNFQEASSPGSHASHVWGNPVWALTSLMAASFARVGWSTEITGLRDDRLIENLLIQEHRTREGDVIRIPLETFIPDQRRVDLAEGGVIVLACRVDSDAAFIVSAPTAHLPERYPSAAETEKSILRATLSYQLFASQFIRYVQRLLELIVPGNTREGIETGFQQALPAVVSRSASDPAGAIQVRVLDSQERPDCYDVILYVQTGREILGGRAELDLRFQIRR